MRYVILIATLAVSAHAQYCGLIGSMIHGEDRDRTFLGIISFNEYGAQSIRNAYGTYGSKYQTNSIFNQYGTFGSEYSQYSPWNRYATSPPLIARFAEDDSTVIFQAVLSANPYATTPTGFTSPLPVVHPTNLMAFLATGECVTTAIARRPATRRGQVMRGKVDVLGRLRHK